MTAFMKGLLDNPVPPYNKQRLVIDYKAKRIWEKGLYESETNNRNGLQERNLVEPQEQNQ